MKKNRLVKTDILIFSVVFFVCLVTSNVKASNKVAEYVSLQEESGIHDDGSVTSTSRYVINVYNKELFDLSVLDTKLDKNYASLDSVYVRITYDDGSFVEPSFKEVVQEVPQYNGSKSLSEAVIYRFSIPQLKDNSNLEMVIKCSGTKRSDMEPIFSVIKVGSKYPIKSWRLHFGYPVSMNLHYKINRGRGRVKVKNDPQLGSLWFVARNIPGYVSEIGGPNDADVMPTIFLSNLSSFSDIVKWHNRQLSVDHFRITSPVSEAMDALLDKYQDDQELLVNKVYEWALKNLKSHTGKLKAVIKQQNAMDVYKNGDLDCRDTSSFIVALYRYLGFEAYEAWINIYGPSELDPKFPIPMFDHAITALKINGKYIFIDATHPNKFGALPQYEQDRPVLILFPDGKYELSKTSVMALDERMWEKRAIVTVDRKGRVIKLVEFLYYGAEAINNHSLMRLTNAELKKYLQDHYVVDNRKLVEFGLSGDGALDDPLILYLKLEQKALGVKEGKTFLVDDPGQSFFNSKIFDSDDRTYDLALGERKAIKSSYKIKMPDNFFISKLPATINVNNKFFSLKRSVEYDSVAGEMDFSEVFIQKVDKVKRGDYKKFKKAYEGLIENDLGQDWVVEMK